MTDEQLQMCLEALVKIHRNTEVIKSCMQDIARDYCDVLFVVHKLAQERGLMDGEAKR